MLNAIKEHPYALFFLGFFSVAGFAFCKLLTALREAQGLA
jgi:hypothetical protein